MLKNQKGFASILIVIIVLVAVVAGSFLFIKSKNENNKNNTNNTQKSSSTDDGKPIIYNFGLESLESIDITNMALREYDQSGRKGFYIFGAPLLKNDPRINPNFEFASVKAGTKVISAINGVVIDVKQQDGDTEIMTMMHENSEWVVGYDHVVGSTLKRGDSVKVGQVLGESARENNGMYRFEFQINGPNDTMYCPTSFLDSRVKSKYESELRTMMEGWNSLKPGLYDLSAQPLVGCAKLSLTNKESQGQ